MAIKVKEEPFKVNSIEVLRKKDGTLSPGITIGSNSLGYVWKPKDPKEAPYVQVYPNVGYHVAGIETKVEVRDSAKPKFSAITEVLTKTVADGVPPSLYLSDSSVTDWEKQVVDYQVFFNKNIYNIVIEDRFFESDGIKEIDNLKPEQIEGARGGEIDFIVGGEQGEGFTKHIPSVIYDLPQRSNITDLEVTPFVKIEANNKEGLQNAINRRLQFDYDNTKPIFSTLGTIQKNRNFVIGDKICVGTKMKSRMYTFGGWYYVKNKTELVKLENNSSYGILASSVPSTGPAEWIGKDMLCIDLSVDFIKHMVKDNNPLNPTGFKPSPIINMFSDDQLTIVAKWLELPYNARITWNDGGVARIGVQPLEQGPVK